MRYWYHYIVPNKTTPGEDAPRRSTISKAAYTLITCTFLIASCAQFRASFNEYLLIFADRLLFAQYYVLPPRSLSLSLFNIALVLSILFDVSLCNSRAEFRQSSRDFSTSAFLIIFFHFRNYVNYKCKKQVSRVWRNIGCVEKRYMMVLGNSFFYSEQVGLSLCKRFRRGFW